MKLTVVKPTNNVKFGSLCVGDAFRHLDDDDGVWIKINEGLCLNIATGMQDQMTHLREVFAAKELIVNF